MAPPCHLCHLSYSGKCSESLSFCFPPSFSTWFPCSLEFAPLVPSHTGIPTFLLMLFFFSFFFFFNQDSHVVPSKAARSPGLARFQDVVHPCLPYLTLPPSPDSLPMLPQACSPSDTFLLSSLFLFNPFPPPKSSIDSTLATACCVCVCAWRREAWGRGTGMQQAYLRKNCSLSIQRDKEGKPFLIPLCLLGLFPPLFFPPPSLFLFVFPVLVLCLRN